MTVFASLELEGANPEDRFAIGLTTQAPLTVGLIPGDYDSIYTVENGASFVPANLGGRIAVDLPLTSDGATLIPVFGLLAWPPGNTALSVRVGRRQARGDPELVVPGSRITCSSV